MYRIIKKPVYTYLPWEVPSDVLKIIGKELSYTPADAQYAERYRQERGYGGRVDPTVHLLTPSSSGGYAFPSGLLPRVEAILSHEHVPYQVVNEDAPERGYASSGEHPYHHAAFTPRYYQTRAAEEATKHKRGIIQHCTGSGKTISIGATILRAGVYPVLVVTHTKTLLTQTHDVLETMLGAPVGLLGYRGSKRIRDYQPVTVCTAQTVNRILDGEGEEREALENFLRQDLRQLHVDESHHVRADTVKRIVQNCRNTEYKIGWSGTPFREQGDDLEIEGALGQVIDRYSYSEAIDEGYILAPRIYRFTFDPKFTFRGYSYQDIVKEYIVGNVLRHRAIARLAVLLANRGEKTLIVVDQVSHGEAITECIPGAVFVQGKNPAKYQKDIMDGFRSGEHAVVVATPLMDEGVDIPEATAIIFASPTRSLVRTYQRIGRVLRKAEGKEKAIVVDIHDKVPMLTQQAKARMKLYEREPRFVIHDRGEKDASGKQWYR